MKLYMKQRVFTWGDKFNIFDANGNDRYYVEGEVFTLGKRLHLLSLDGTELSYIQQKILTFLPKYYVFRNGVQIAEIVKEFTFFCHEYTVNGLGWKVTGDFLSHDYEVTRNGFTIARVSKQWFTWGDTYEVDIDDGVDEVTTLSVVLVIDACLAAAQNNSNN